MTTQSTRDINPRVVFTNASLGYRANTVLRDVNLTLAAGELVGLVGRSGAGKTTMISALCGANVLLEGTVTIDGVDPARMPHPVGFVPQLNNDTVSTLSVLELVALGNPRKGLRTTRTERHHAAELLSRLGLEGLGNRRVDELSGGQRQRVAIARALTASSALLLCDEPTSGADPVLTSEIVNVLTEVAASGTTVVVATHDVTTVTPQLDRLIGVGNGAIVFDGAPDTFGQQQQAEVYGPGILTRGAR